jgi:hypothetical protein
MDVDFDRRSVGGDAVVDEVSHRSDEVVSNIAQSFDEASGRRQDLDGFRAACHQ